jgi:probable phosphoglycerate mutase
VLEGHRFAGVLVSPLQRAQRTCALAGLTGQAQPCPDLQEWDYGRYEGITTAEIRAHNPHWSQWRDGCPGGESAADVQQRCERVIAKAEALALGMDQQGVQQVALFAHGHILRSLAGTWLGLGAQSGALLSLATGSISVLGQEREQRTILRWNVPNHSL